jgi:hypothetical protein
MKKIIAIAVAVVLVITAFAMVGPVSAGQPEDKGFDEYGYNYQARIFVGIGEDWYRGKYRDALDDPGPWQEGQDFLWDETYGPDHLVMKWSKAWDDARFHGGAWTPKAWSTNEWNGMFPGGSGETWRYTNIWVGPELESSPYWREGGYAIWGQFEVIMSHGVVDGEHIWDALATPCGRGRGGP